MHFATPAFSRSNNCHPRFQCGGNRYPRFRSRKAASSSDTAQHAKKVKALISRLFYATIMTPCISILDCHELPPPKLEVPSCYELPPQKRTFLRLSPQRAPKSEMPPPPKCEISPKKNFRKSASWALRADCCTSS